MNICNFFRNLCRRVKPALTFEEAIKLEKLEAVKTSFATIEQLNTALLEAINAKNSQLVQILVEKGATNLNEGLKQACILNSLVMAEIFAKAGANLMVGIAYTKSTNIFQMLHRYKQHSELIK